MTARVFRGYEAEDPRVRGMARAAADRFSNEDVSVAMGELMRTANAAGLDCGRPYAKNLIQRALADRDFGANENGASSEAAVTWRTLADIDATPAGPLLLDMFEPEGPTLLYGAGGLGKGMTTAWACRELVRVGMRPLIYDAENRPKEWARRADGLGIDRTSIAYVQPHDLPKELHGLEVWLIVPYLGRVARAAGADIVFLDSVLAALNVNEERLKSDAGAPYHYVGALDNELGLPSVSIGHTPKGSPEGDPYGSVSWVNAMRLTWLGTPAQGDGHRVRWRPRKRNERGKIAAVQLAFTYGDDGRPVDVERLDDERSTRDWIVSQLMNGPATVEDLAESMAAEGDDYGDAVVSRCKDQIRMTLNRMRKSGHVHKGRGRGAPWALGGTS